MTSLPFPVRRGMALSLVLVLSSALAACSSSSPSTGASGSTGGGTVAVTDGNVDITADDILFNATTITAPSGEAFTITLINNDSVQHNVAIYTEEGGDEIAIGELIDGGQTSELSVGALEPGTYYFQCDLHPTMKGMLVVEG